MSNGECPFISRIYLVLVVQRTVHDVLMIRTLAMLPCPRPERVSGGVRVRGDSDGPGADLDSLTLRDRGNADQGRLEVAGPEPRVVGTWDSPHR